MLTKDETAKNVEHTLFRSMIHNLLYLKATSPDIFFSLDISARFQAAPKESHLNAIKHIKHVNRACEHMKFGYLLIKILS